MDLLEMVQMENLDEEQKVLAELIGLEAFKSLVRAFNGTSIYIPKIESLEKTVRDELIKEEFDGSNYKELALKYGLTETWIRNIVLDKAKAMSARSSMTTMESRCSWLPLVLTTKGYSAMCWINPMIMWWRLISMHSVLIWRAEEWILPRWMILQLLKLTPEQRYLSLAM